MSRIRTIKPEFFEDEDLQDLQATTSLPVMLVFAGLWTQADRRGRFEWTPRRLKLRILPFLDYDLAETLELLSSRKFIVSYEVGGRRYGCIQNFLKHQRPNPKESDSMLPAPPEHDLDHSLEQSRSLQGAPKIAPGNDLASGEREGEREEERNKPLAPAPPPPGDSKKPAANTQTPQRRVPDERFAAFKHTIEAYWQHKNPGTPMPWDGSEAKRLTEFLKACPSIELAALQDMLRNRARSDVIHTERPRAWIASLTDYAGGPLDRFRRPESAHRGAAHAPEPGIREPESETFRPTDPAGFFVGVVDNDAENPGGQSDGDYVEILVGTALDKYPEAAAFGAEKLRREFTDQLPRWRAVMRREAQRVREGVATC